MAKNLDKDSCLVIYSGLCLDSVASSCLYLHRNKTNQTHKPLTFPGYNFLSNETQLLLDGHLLRTLFQNPFPSFLFTGVMNHYGAPHNSNS